MTRKDYVALAEALKDAGELASARPDWDWERTWEQCMYEVAAVLETDNPRFDRARFLRACYGRKTDLDLSRERM